MLSDLIPRRGQKSLGSRFQLQSIISRRTVFTLYRTALCDDFLLISPTKPYLRHEERGQSFLGHVNLNLSAATDANGVAYFPQESASRNSVTRHIRLAAVITDHSQTVLIVFRGMRERSCFNTDLHPPIHSSFATMANSHPCL